LILGCSIGHSDFIAAPATKRQIPRITGRNMVSIKIVTTSVGPVAGIIPNLRSNQNITATRNKNKPIRFRCFFFVLTG
jgi:hypothetical protein